MEIQRVVERPLTVTKLTESSWMVWYGTIVEGSIQYSGCAVRGGCERVGRSLVGRWTFSGANMSMRRAGVERKEKVDRVWTRAGRV